MIAFRHTLLATSGLALAAAVLIGQSGTTAAPNNDLPRNLVARVTAPPHVSVQRNPFVAFVVPHREVTVAPIGRSDPRFGRGPGSVVNAPADYVPNPGGMPGGAPQQSKQMVVLCDTWTSSAATARDFTPTAVFMVGTFSLIAVAGDEVGGYRVRDIAADSVGFDTGDRLGFGDCRPPQTLEQNSASQPQDQQQPVAPQQFTRPQIPQVPQVRAPGTGLDGQPPSLNPGYQTPAGPYGSSASSTYSNGIYGANPPAAQQNQVSPFGLFTYPGAPK